MMIYPLSHAYDMNWLLCAILILFMCLFLFASLCYYFLPLFALIPCFLLLLAVIFCCFMLFFARPLGVLTCRRGGKEPKKYPFHFLNSQRWLGGKKECCISISSAPRHNRASELALKSTLC